jgi:hypothetical protein
MEMDSLTSRTASQSTRIVIKRNKKLRFPALRVLRLLLPKQLYLVNQVN